MNDECHNKLKYIGRILYLTIKDKPDDWINEFDVKLKDDLLFDQILTEYLIESTPIICMNSSNSFEYA